MSSSRSGRVSRTTVTQQCPLESDQSGLERLVQNVRGISVRIVRIAADGYGRISMTYDGREKHELVVLEF